MGWTDWLSWRRESKSHGQEGSDGTLPRKATGSWERNLNAFDYTPSTETIVGSILTTAATLLFIRTYKTYIRRIPNVEYLKPGLFRRRSLYGYVTSVGDGDNFRLFHTPGGKLLGWGWLPGRQPEKMKKLSDKTVHVRIAGVDAPELAHFGRPAQPYSQEALDWLRSFVLHKYVRAYPYRRDQYERVVCMVYKRRWLFFRSDVGENMLKTGLATVYEAKFGSEFGGKEEQYKQVQQTAKQKRVGMWAKPGFIDMMLGKKEQKLETPRDYKTRIAEGEKAAGKKK